MNEIKENVTEVLLELGLPMDIPGFRYLQTAVELAVADSDDTESENAVE